MEIAGHEVVAEDKVEFDEIGRAFVVVDMIEGMEQEEQEHGVDRVLDA
jgi:hypothetical protein